MLINGRNILLPPSDKLASVLKSLDNLNEYDLQEVTNYIRNKAGIVAIKESNYFDVNLIACDYTHKIQAIKFVRNITKWGLKESKDLVDELQARDTLSPCIKRHVTLEEGERIKKLAEEIKAEVEIVPNTDTVDPKEEQEEAQRQGNISPPLASERRQTENKHLTAEGINR